MLAIAPNSINPRILATVKQYWGFDTLRPLQQQAIQAGIEHRDSLVVLPTGGGKSLCYQVPPAVVNRTDVVVSPLISLMKDQVDGLREAGYPAAALHSGLTDAERREIERGIAQKEYRLVFASPERLLTSPFLNIIQRLDVRAFHIDEAHCISQWGHDFRPEYRQMSSLKQRFPQASVHAYTATATPRVREDIVHQLQLADPNILVGIFDRPNLVYRFVPRTDLAGQVIGAIRRHDGEAVIVYCISRKDTENLAATLVANGIKAAPYHAGMEKNDRNKTQERFAEERLDVVVATVAFGMGIDRSNVRCVIHAAMPKTVEHYQQESGRAGRDGLEAECIMLYSGGDVVKWKGLIGLSADRIDDFELQKETIAGQEELLEHVSRMCNTLECRHRVLSRYFGQTYPSPNCGACDVCLGEVQGMADSTVVAQKILSCVARVEQRFGVGHVCDVLLGANTEMIRKCGHQSLSTYGLLKEYDKKSLQSLVYQLIDQQVLARTPGEMPIVMLTEASRAVMKGEHPVQLIEPKTGAVKRAKVEEASWEGVDRDLFDRLREWRKAEAAKRGVPAFVILGDAVLRELAAVRPDVVETFRRVKGIGEAKQREFGETLIGVISAYCDEHGLARNNFRTAGIVKPKSTMLNAGKQKAFDLFERGCTIEETASAIGRAVSTTLGYLVEFVNDRKPASVDPWVDARTYQRVMETARSSDTGLLKPIFEAMGGEVPYEQIRVVLSHAAAMNV